MGSLSLLQGIFLTQELIWGLLHCSWILYQLSHQESPRILEWVPTPSPGDLSDPGIELGSPALQADFFYHLSHQGSPENKRTRSYTQNRDRPTDIENKHGYQRGEGGRDKLGVWD